MKKLAACFLLFPLFLLAQSHLKCKNRFDTYLNFHGKLNNLVKFEKEVIYIRKPEGQGQLAIYKEEIDALGVFFGGSTNTQQQKLISLKGLKRFTAAQLDSLVQVASKPNQNAKGLSGMRIVIDPGHFAANFNEAVIEQKYLYFTCPGLGQNNDTVRLFETVLTFNTARILQQMLEKQGATVILTRSAATHTSFDCTFSYWLIHHKQRVLDSLVKCGSITAQYCNKLKKSNSQDLFRDFFRDYELSNRAKKTNAFGPHITIIIHYNVDEKNSPWKKTSQKNFTMAFIPGAFTSSDLKRNENRADFIRLLLTDQLNQSERLAAQTVLYFNKHLGVKIATANDATYLAEKCNKTPSSGVFCRNLLLCRKINSPLVYGEALYQDNVSECWQLMKTDTTVYGIQTNRRIATVAQSYYEAVLKYVQN